MVKVVDTVNVHPKLFVKVITGVLAPNPVMVCPDTEPRLLAKVEMVCAGKAGEVLLIKITPLLFPQVGFVKDNVAVGLGLTVTTVVCVPTQPDAVVPVTV